MGKNIHIVKHSEGWAVKSEGSHKAAHVTSTQDKAITLGRKMAKASSSGLVIHGKDGRIRDS